MSLVRLAAVVVAAHVFLVGCSQCRNEEVQRDGACLATCNTNVDCRLNESCVDGACEPGASNNNTSSGVVGSSSSVDMRVSSSVGASSTAGSSSAGGSTGAATSGVMSSSAGSGSSASTVTASSSRPTSSSVAGSSQGATSGVTSGTSGATSSSTGGVASSSVSVVSSSAPMVSSSLLASSSLATSSASSTGGVGVSSSAVGSSTGGGGSSSAASTGGGTTSSTGGAPQPNATLQWTGMMLRPEPQNVGGVAADTSGNIYVVGSFQASATDTDAFIARFSGTGTLLAQQVISGAGTQYFTSVVVDNNNVIYAAGGTESPLGGDTFRGVSDAMVVRFDQNLTIAWIRLGGGSDADVANAVDVTPTGHVVIMGQTASNSVDGQPATGGWDFFYSQYGSDGTSVRSRVAGTGATTDTGIGGAVDDTGNIIMTGYTQPGTTHPLVVMWLGDGTQLYATSLSNISGVGSAVVTMAGRVFIAGMLDAAVGAQPYRGGASDVFAAEVNPMTGTTDWVTLVGGPGDDGSYPYLPGLTLSPCGLFVGAQTTGPVGGVPTQGGTDNVLFGVGFNGVPGAARLVGGSGAEFSPRAVAYLSQGQQVIQAGWTDGTFGGNTATGQDVTLAGWTVCQ